MAATSSSSAVAQPTGDLLSQHSARRCYWMPPADHRLPTLNVQVEADIRSPADGLELVFDPRFHVGRSVADMPADTEAGWSFPPIPPLVQGGHRHSEIVGEVFHTE